MDGLIVAWSKDEIQAIDQDNFQEMVVDVVEKFFDDVQDETAVTVVWRTENRDHKTRYQVTQSPQLGLNSCYVDIEGGRGGEYRIELDPDEMSIRPYSTDSPEELTYLEFKIPAVAIDNETNRIALSEIPEKIKKKAVRAAPDIEW